MRNNDDPLSDQADSYRQVEDGPRSVRGENLGWLTALGQRETAAVAEGKTSPTVECAHGAGELGVGFEYRFDGHSCSTEQFTDPRGFDADVDQLPDHLSQVRRTEKRRVEF